MTARITRVRTKQGDQGYSNLASGLRMRKSNSICSFQNTLQLFSNALRLFIYHSDKFDSLDKKDMEFLNELVSTFVNNLSASTYFSFENEKYSIPIDTLVTLDNRIEYLYTQVGETKEFIIVDKDLLHLEQALIYTRELEHLFWKVVDQNNYYSLSKDNKKQEVVNSISSFLNALSDYFFLLIRYLSKDLTYWNSK